MAGLISALERLRSETLAFGQAREQVRVKERAIDTQRADERAARAAAVDPALLAGIEHVVSALREDPATALKELKAELAKLE